MANFLRLFLSSAVGVSITLNAFAKDLDVAFGQNRPPFIFQESGKWKGLEVDIVQEALSYKGHSIRSSAHMVNRRLEIAVAQMDYDAAAGVQYIDDGTFYSNSFVTYINYAISRAGEGVVINSIQDLTKYKPAAWQNAYRNLGPEFVKYYGPESDGDYLKDYMEFGNQEAQNAFFWAGRANVIIVDKFIFLWYRKQLANQYNTGVDLVFHKIFPKETSYQVNFRDKNLRDDFNEGLQFLRESGRYQQLFDQYIQ